MSKPIQELIDHLIALARAQGLSQADLAQRAGLSAVGFSKAKHRGDLRASTLAELAAQLDLQLVLQPRQTPEAAADAIKAGRFFRHNTDTSKQAG